MINPWIDARTPHSWDIESSWLNPISLPWLAFSSTVSQLDAAGKALPQLADVYPRILSNPTFVFVKGGWTVLEDGVESNEQKRKSTI
jgi:hypothetical protein